MEKLEEFAKQLRKQAEEEGNSKCRDTDKEKEEEEEEKEYEKREPKMFVHDVAVSRRMMYPWELWPERSIARAMESLKGKGQFQRLHSVLTATEHGQRLLVALFWLYFCLNFDGRAYAELGVGAFL